jgi:LmbE family N-acetylglucosaminyl deacetylase
MPHESVKTVAEFVERVPASALAIYAHPDDPDVSCGGTLARWAARGCRVEVVVCTTGDKGTADPSLDPGDLTTTREKEMAAAAEVLGVAVQHRLGYPDGELQNDELFRRQLVRLIRSVRPEAVICPDPTAAFFGQDYFNHRDHRMVGWAALDALAPAAALPHYFPEAGPPHQVAVVYLSGTLEPDVWVDVSAALEQKVKAVLCHQSQLREGAERLGQVVRGRAAEAGRAAGVAAAEPFRRLRLGGEVPEQRVQV